MSGPRFVLNPVAHISKMTPPSFSTCNHRYKQYGTLDAAKCFLCGSWKHFIVKNICQAVKALKQYLQLHVYWWQISSLTCTCCQSGYTCCMRKVIHAQGLKLKKNGVKWWCVSACHNRPVELTEANNKRTHGVHRVLQQQKLQYLFSMQSSYWVENLLLATHIWMHTMYRHTHNIPC